MGLAVVYPQGQYCSAVMEGLGSYCQIRIVERPVSWQPMAAVVAFFGLAGWVLHREMLHSCLPVRQMVDARAIWGLGLPLLFHDEGAD